MSRTKKLQGDCAHCGMPINFPAENIGTTAICPHCRKATELLLALPPNEPLIPRRVLVWTVITLLLLIVGFFGALTALNRAKKMAGERTSPATNAAPARSR